MSKDDVRCVKSARSQVTVGELYRWILAKLSDKDIKRALHKYRDLMPRQSDWNRKLTQATNIPELGFRYLYRCGQIDETNHRTMQKMLKYIDRQDVLPYFDTILYNTNNSNASIEQLRNGLLDKVTNFITLCDMEGFKDVFGLPYTISQCQPVANLRLTRSVRKRMSAGDCGSCLTAVKIPKLDSELQEEFLSTNDRETFASNLNNSSVTCDKSKPTENVNNENFATRVLTCLKQSRQRYRNIPILNNCSLPGVIEAPIQLLLHKNNNNSNLKTSVENQSRTVADDEVVDPDDKVFDHLKEVYLKHKESDLAPGFFYAKIRVRIRMDSGNYLEELNNLQSPRTESLDRQMDIISQTSSFLREREAGEMICELRCTDLDQVECLWRDYQTGMLKKRLSDILLAAPESNLRHFNESVPYIGGIMMPNLKLHVFISRYEYESCRSILMRNLTAVYVHRQTPQAPSAPAPPPSGHVSTHTDTVHETHNTHGHQSQQRFPAVQQLMAQMRELSQTGVWPPGPRHVTANGRTALMHMYYPQQSFIPVTVNPLLRPIHLMSATITAAQQLHQQLQQQQRQQQQQQQQQYQPQQQ